MAKKEIKTLDEVVNEVLDEETKSLLEVQAGIRSSLDKVVTKVVKRTGGRADPRRVRQIIIRKL